MSSASTLKLLDPQGASILLLFIIFSISFLISPYTRSRFDYSRSSWQKLLITSGCWLLFVYVVILTVGHNIAERVANILNYPSFWTVDNLLSNMFDDEWMSKHKYLYLSCHIALAYRVAFIIIRWFFIRYLYLLYQDHLNSKGRREDYEALLESIGRPVNLESWLRFSLDQKAIPYIKILQKADVPFQWLQLPLYKLSNLLDEAMEHCEKRFIENDIKSLDELNWNKRQILIQFQKLTHLQIFIFSIGVDPEKSIRHFESVYGLIPDWLHNGDRDEEPKKYGLLEKYYKYKEALFRPLQDQRHAAITAQAVQNAADIMAQIYKSMEGRSTLKKYCYKNNIEPCHIRDINTQQTMVSIHLRSGRIYCGWIIYSTRPGKADTGLTLLPYVSKVRLDQVEGGNKTEATKIVTNYKNLVWDFSRNQIGGLLPEMLEYFIVLVGEIEYSYAKNLKKLFEEYSGWLKTEYLEALFCSDGHNFEIDQLLKMFPNHASKYYKSFQLEDIEQIQPYNPSLGVNDFKPAIE